MSRHIPLWIKLPYTAYAAVMVPYYWQYWGPQNFLYFCDVAFLVTLVAIWWESPLLIGMQTIAILILQTYWLIDFFAHLAGFHALRMTDYMFDPRIPRLLRGLSLFHGWLPILLFWLVHRLGYDRRAFFLQTIVGVVLLLICYFGFAPPGSHGSGRMAANINYVFGLSDAAPQTIMPALAWLGMLMVALPMLIYWPTHLVLARTVARYPPG